MEDAVLHGDRVALGPLRTDLVPEYARWVNDPALKPDLLSLGLQTAETERDWVTATAAQNASPRPTQANFTVWDRSDGAPIGTAALKDVDWVTRSAEFGILLGLSTRAPGAVGLLLVALLGAAVFGLGLWAQKKLVDANWDPTPHRPAAKQSEAAKAADAPAAQVRTYPKIAPPAGAPVPPAKIEL